MKTCPDCAEEVQDAARVGARPVVAAAVVLLFAVLAGALPQVSEAAPQRPNVVLVFTDDQDPRSFSSMQRVQRRIAQRGTTFDNAFASFPLCCPARASLLTGQYAHNHGVMDNSGPSGGYDSFRDGGTLPVSLNRAGYRTAYMGKYLSGYTTSIRRIPPGWDRWFVRGRERYFRWTANDNGRVRRFGTSARDYQTDVVSRRARSFVRRSAPRRQPFFLTVSYSAPHGPPVSAPRHRKRFRSARVPRPPSFNEGDVSDKPDFVSRRPSLTGRRILELNQLYRNRLRTLAAVDQGVGGILEQIARAGEGHRTLVIFTTDNGFLLGEHRLSGKPWLYEESVRTPFFIRGPGFPAGARRGQVVGNIDIAPTILDLARARPLRRIDGRSLIPLAQDPGVAADREVLLQTRISTGVRSEQFLYAQNPKGQNELYDMRADPYQLDNVAGDPRYAPEQTQLAARLAALRDCRGSTCR